MTDKYFEKLLEHRRNLHRIPETAFNEFQTGEYLKDCLYKAGCFNVQLMAKTGIIASYTGGSGDYIAFRTDIDALKIKEETGLEFSSVNDGFMHACGHDLHMSMLLTLAEWIGKTRPEKNILLIFQPAEEGFGGGELMVKEGLFSKFKVKEIYALHNTNEFPVGVIALNNGKMFAGTIEFEIILEGKGGHAAVPHQNSDLITAAAQLVTLLNTIEPRFLDPVHENLLSIGMIHAGEAANILPSQAVIKGTARSYYKDDLSVIKNKLKDMCSSVSIAFGLKSKLIIHSEYIPALNNPDIADRISSTDFGKNIKVTECEKKMTGEDFGFMLEAVPGAIAWLGAGNDTNMNFGLHNKAYNPDEKAMAAGFAYYKKLIESFKK
ncbi:MAG TPA: M20 family metallopeptidase [Clostridiales bacterium]|jgi:N-acetyldiaminopimelate deacetylase|nr:M20 family metallopeptidase [Clostridiales bacterium]HQP69728.1 M20 family metallopeptidase [Clostridiales bacterium]